MADDDILGRLAYAESVFGPTGFQGKAVVTAIQRTVFYQYVLARFNVYTVATGHFGRVDRYPPDNDVLAIDGYYVP